MPVHTTAMVHPTAHLAESVKIGPYAHVGAFTRLGEGCIVREHAWVGERIDAGPGNVFHPYSMVGGDPQFLGFDPRTKSGIRIGEKNEFREFSTIHRGLKDDSFTTIGNENYFMAYSHVAHDCLLGDHIVMVNYAALSGHTSLEDRVFFSGHSSTHQFCRIGKLAMIGGMSGVVKDVPPFMTLKHYGVVVGLNLVGLRRAGVPAPTRTALKHAYKELFRSGRPVSRSIARLREEWQGRDMPEELAHLLDFCSAPSKRGLSRGPTAASANAVRGSSPAEEPEADE